MKPGALVAVVVLGEIARSPRMLNHARQLARNGFAVVIVGYRGREFEIPCGVRVHALGGGHGASPGATGLRFIFSAGFRMARLFFSLSLALLREKPGAILVQNPPSFPTLTAAVIAAGSIRASVIVDWHNYGFSLLALRLGNAHPLVRAARWYEFRAARHAAAHLCVSRAMQEDLARHAGIRVEVLYDRPVCAIASEIAPAPGFTAVCPAGWTADEDIELLLDALDLIPIPSLTIYITGDGAKRGALAPRLLALRKTGILFDTGFIPESEYRDLLRRADLGLSLHRSSSGLDLAMKVVDLYSAGVPVCALDYGGSIGEQIEDGVTGFLFRTARELANLLTRLASDKDEIHAMRNVVRLRWATSWNDAWNDATLPILTALP